MKISLFRTLVPLAALVFVTSAEAQPTQEEPNAAPPLPTPSPVEEKVEPEGIRISGYLQAQYESHADSRDELRENGALLNQDRFLIRRARLKASRESEYSFFMLELDGSTKSGPSLRLYRAEAALQYRGDRPTSQPPLVKATVGLFDIPFGHELVESSRSRVFMERSRASRAFFPANPDVGARLSGELSFFQYAIAVQNGEPFGTRYSVEDPNAAKDFAGRVGARFEPTKDLEVRGGFSGLVGKGFHAGQEGAPSANFDRWLAGADLGLRLKTAIGKTQLSAEIQGGTNMDRGSFAADPVALSADVRELGFYVALVQEITPYAVVGFRYDEYAPYAAIVNRRGEAPIATTRAIRTYSPVIGAVLPGRAKLLFQYDFIDDRQGKTSLGEPTNLANDTITLRLQVEP